MVNKDHIELIKNNCKDATIVAASKYVDSGTIKELLSLGITNFGENRVDAFLTKYEELKGEDITWHFIGHLQRNKAKLIADKIDYLHSLDSLELASILSKNRTSTLKCFVEVKLTSSTTKHGIDEKELKDFISKANQLDNIEIIGLMGMSDKEMEDKEKQLVFKHLKELANENSLINTSMGMSDDYLLALEEGANYVRLGRILFK